MVSALSSHFKPHTSLQGALQSVDPRGPFHARAARPRPTLPPCPSSWASQGSGASSEQELAYTRGCVKAPCKL